MFLHAETDGKEKTIRQAELFLFGVYVTEKQTYNKNSMPDAQR